MVTAHASALLPWPGWIHGSRLPLVIFCIAATWYFHGNCGGQAQMHTERASQELSHLCLQANVMFAPDGDCGERGSL